ncbi:unnamed protein product [Microthlaspi erraticum]|uniref:GBF-interacting protein 1 N-terminal domain-containing protein n=1 Tax=Microthlaspi erraticum TaxID=1685480 RepID=A0A6D2HIA1_9BRAS|nr:unnamed protein product [Microthlaspi erraticum]
MNTNADGGSSRVSIPHHLRKTIQSIREITGKQHSDEDIFAVYTDSFNDPHETAQKLLFLDTFHEVKSKREKKKENVVPINQASGRSGRRNYASSNNYHDAGNGRGASFKRESGANHVTGGPRTSLPATNKARNLTVPRAIRVSGPTSVPNGVGNPKVEDDSTATATVAKGLAEKNPPAKSTSSSEGGVEPETSKAVSEPVAAPASVAVVQNHVQDVTSAQISQPVVNNQPAELQSSTFTRQEPSLFFASRCSSSQSDTVIGNDTACNKAKAQSLVRKPDVGERSHVIFPFHLQGDEVLQTALTFGSFDSNFVIEASSNNGASGGDSNFESSHGTGDDEGDSSPTSNGIPGFASARDGPSSDSNSAPGAELVRHSDHIVPSVEDEVREITLLNPQTHRIAYGQEAPLGVFGLVPSFSALGLPINTETAVAQPGSSSAPAISYPQDQFSIAAAAHLYRQQYPPSYFPYGPYYPQFYMPPPPYIHQYLGANGIPQQSYFPPGAALAAPTHITPLSDAENPPTTDPSPQASSIVATHIPSATALNSVHTAEMTSPMTESAAAWIGQGLGNLQLNPLYNLALQRQPLGFPVVQAGQSGVIGMHQPSQPMAAASTTYQTLPPPPHTTTTMPEPIGHPHIAYQQQPQNALTNWLNNC